MSDKSKRCDIRFSNGWGGSATNRCHGTAEYRHENESVCSDCAIDLVDAGYEVTRDERTET